MLSGSVAACGSESKEPLGRAAPVQVVPLGSDRQALEQLAAVRAELQNLQRCSPNCLRTLEELGARFPAEDDVVVLRRAAYFQLQDWEALIELAEHAPALFRTVGGKAELASIYYKAGRFQEAAMRLEAVLEGQPGDPNLVRQYAIVLFELGKHDEVLAQLDAVLGELQGGAAAEAEMLRGLIHFYRDDLAVAERHLTRALELNQESLVALSGLARVRAAQGRKQSAQRLLDRAQGIRQADLAATRHALRLSSQSQSTSAACMARDWEECLRLIEIMLAEATSAEKARIYRYQSQILATAGRPAEAKAAQARAEAVAQETEEP